MATKRYITLALVLLAEILTTGSFSFLVPAYVSASTMINNQAMIINPTPPIMKDVNGNELTSSKIGQMVMLSTRVFNPRDNDQPFVLIMEVRDENGVTIYLEWQTGTLNPHGVAEISLSWTPGMAGEYRLRTFAISGFVNPQVLTIDVDNTAIVEE